MTCPIGTILRCPTADERRIEYYHSLGMTAMQIAGVMENWLAPTDEAIARSEAIMAMLRERGRRCSSPSRTKTGRIPSKALACRRLRHAPNA